MNRRLIVFILLGVALCALAVAWFFKNFEQVSVTEKGYPQREAQQNRYLAFERMAGQLGRPVNHLSSSQALASLPPGGVLLLDSKRVQSVNSERAEQLLAWVEQGAYLVVAAEQVGADPILKKLGVKSRPQAEHKKSRQTDPTDDSDEELEELLELAEVMKSSPVSIILDYELRLPQSDVGYRIENTYLQYNLVSESEQKPAWRAGPKPDEVRVLHIPYGGGQITVFSDFRFLNNTNLADQDHAELIWALMQRYQPQGTVSLATRLDVPSLWSRLLEHAASPLLAALLAALLLILLWLWRIVPRFGDTLPHLARERRGLIEHLTAMGRCVAREEGLTYWMQMVRQDLHQRLLRHRPAILKQDAAQQEKALAEIADSTPQDVAQAIGPGAIENRASFTRAVQVMQRIDQRL